MDKPLIRSKEELKLFLIEDAKANYRTSVKTRISRDEIWKFIKCMRYLQYLDYARKYNILLYIPFIVLRKRYRALEIRLGFSIDWTTHIGKGFCLPHYGTIVIHPKTIIGDNCKCHVGVNIGATNGQINPPKIGNNVFIGPGVIIVGDITIADDTAIGAGAVVVKTISQEGLTWGGVPAKMISQSNSHIHLSKLLGLE